MSLGHFRFRVYDDRYVNLELDLNQTVGDCLNLLQTSNFLRGVRPELTGKASDHLSLFVPPRDSSMGGWWLKNTDTLKYLVTSFGSSAQTSTYTSPDPNVSSPSAGSSASSSSSSPAIVLEVKHTAQPAYFGIGELSDMWVRAFDPASGGRGAWEELLIDYHDKLAELIPQLQRLLKVRKGEEYLFRQLVLTPVKSTLPLNVNLSLEEQDVLATAPYILLSPITNLMRIQADQIKSPSVSGWLTKISVKEGKTTGAKRRWCVVSDSFLFYFKGQTGQPAGVVPLEYYSLNVEKGAGRSQFELAYTGLGFCRFRPNFVFTSESQMDLDKWSTNVRSRCFDGASKCVFGIALQKLLRRADQQNDGVPTIARDTLVALASYINEEGLFRKSGSATVVANLKAAYDSGQRPDLAQISDPHAIAGVLKLWLRELPEPLLTYELFQPFLDVLDLTTEEAQIRTAKRLVKRLPAPNLALIVVLLPFLHDVSLHEASNLMHAANLATVFGPNVLSPPDSSLQNMMHLTASINKLVEFLIKQTPAILSTSSSSTSPSATPPADSTAAWGRAPLALPASTSASTLPSTPTWGGARSAQTATTPRGLALGSTRAPGSELPSPRNRLSLTPPSSSPSSPSSPSSSPPAPLISPTAPPTTGERPSLPSRPPRGGPGSFVSGGKRPASQTDSLTLSQLSLEEQIRILTERLDEEIAARLRLEAQVTRIKQHLSLE